MKAIEAARRAIEAHPAYDCGSTGDQEMAEAAIRAYLTALSEDDAECERIGFEISLHAHIIAEGGEDDGIANPAEVGRAAIRAMGGE